MNVRLRPSTYAQPAVQNLDCRPKKMKRTKKVKKESTKKKLETKKFKGNIMQICI